MATIILDLKECAITDTGEVIVKYDHLVFGLLLAGKSIQGLKTFRQSQAEWYVAESFSDSKKPDTDVEIYNYRRGPDRGIPIVMLDGVAERPAVECFEYNIPLKYLEIDLMEYTSDRLSKLFPDAIPPEYVKRLKDEFDKVCERQMQDLFRTVIYVIDRFEQENIVYGVGRGSSCASLMLYLIGLHMVDPVENDISIDEFLREDTDTPVNT